MLVNIIQVFDFGPRRFLTGENVDVDPQIATRWVAEGKATIDTDGVQNGPSGGLTATDLVNDLVTGGTGKALAAPQGPIIAGLLARKVWYFNGAPNDSDGANGDRGVRVDWPFEGIPYTRTGGTWVVDDNTATLAAGPKTLPAAAAQYVGLRKWVTDAGTYGAEFDCVTDGAGGYFWFATLREWDVSLLTAATGGLAGNAAFQQAGSDITLPTRTDLYVSGMEIHMEAHYAVTVNDGIATKTVECKEPGGTVFSFQQIAAGTAAVLQSSRTRAILEVGTVSSLLYQIPNSGSASGYTAGTGVESVYTTLTLPGLVLRWGQIISTVNASGQFRKRRIRFVYPKG